MSLGFANGKNQQTDNATVNHALVARDGRIDFSNSDVDFTGSTVTGLTAPPPTLPAPLTSIAGLVTSPNDMIFTVASDTYATTTLTGKGRDLLREFTASGQRGVIGVSIGSDVQAHSTGLDSISAQSAGAGVDEMIYTTAADTWTRTGLTAFGRTLIDDATAADARTTLDAVERAPGGTSTLNSVARWAATDGGRLDDSGVTIDGSDNVAGVNDLGVGGNLALVGNLDGITPAERGQLNNIGTTTISAGQWAFLGASDQGVATTDTPAFVGLNSTSAKIINLAAPTASTDAANKSYVDSVAATGLSPIEACVLGTDAVLPNAPTYAHPAETLTAGANANLVVDGTATVGAERVLVKDQAANTQNGVYTVTTAGDGANPWVLTRASDFDQAATPIPASTFVFVEGGTANGNTSWVLDAAVTTISPLTDPVVWDQFSAGQNLTAGSGLSEAAGAFNVNIAPGRTVVNGSDQVDLVVPVVVASGGTGATSLVSGNVLVGQGTSAVSATKAAPSGDFIGTTDSQAMTNKTLTAGTNTIRASQVATTGADVVLTGGAPPSTGQVMTALGATTANWQTPSSFAFSRTLTVSPSGADHTTIAAAIAAASALTPTAAAKVLIQVFPATYSEVNPLIVPSNVVVSGAEIPTVVVTPATSTGAAVFQLSASSGVFGIVARGASGAGGVGFNAPSAGNAQCQSCIAEDCETGYRGSGLGTVLFVQNCLAQGTTTTTLATGFFCTTGAVVGAAVASATGAFGGTPVSIGFHCTGAGSLMFMGTAQAQLCLRGFLSESGGLVRLTGGEIVACVTAGIEIGASATMEMYGVSVSSSVALDVNVTAATATFLGAGNKFRSDLVSFATGSSFTGVSVSQTPGDIAVVVRGELHVGTVDEPSESVFGGGDSHVQGMTVLRTSDDVAFTDITSDVALPDDGNTAAAFNSTAAGERLYVGGSFAAFPGIRPIVTVAIVPAGGTAGSLLTWEFWNGSTWTEFDIMSTDASNPYVPHARAAFDLGTFQFRFGPMTGWTTTTVDGTPSFWVRVTIAGGGLSTVPTLDQIKLHTNRTEINGNGFVEFFGSARPKTRYNFDWNNFVGSTSSPGNKDVFIEDAIGVGRTQNSFSSNGTRRVSMNMELPPELDTSFPMTLTVRYLGESGSSGNVRFVVRWGYALDLADDPSPVGTTVSSVFTGTAAAPTTAPGRLGETVNLAAIASGTSDRMLHDIYVLDVSPLVSSRSTGSTLGDVMWISFERTGNDAADTYPGVVNAIQLCIKYVKWNEGQFSG